VANLRRPYGATVIFELATQDCVRSCELVLGYFPCLPTGGSPIFYSLWRIA